jgi:hypothetical protein
MEEHVDALHCYLRQTPAESDAAETKTATAVTRLLMVLPSERKSELDAEAMTDVFLEELEDMPWWAVKSACKRWLRHDCGTDERGQLYNYRWAPDPGTLWRVAYGETYQVKERIRQLQRVLDARPYVDCSSLFADGRAAMGGLNKLLKMGTADRTLTFAQAVEIGTKTPGEAPMTDDRDDEEHR